MADNPVGSRVKGLSLGLGAIDTVAVSLRLLARSQSKASFGADDFAIVFSLIPLYCMIAIGYLAVDRGGMGLSVAALREEQISTFLKVMMAGMVVYSFTITTAKVSVLLLYRRIFATQAFRRRTTVIMILCITWSIVAIFTEIFQCRPFSAAFNLEHILTDSCIDLQAYYWGIAISNLLMDFVLLILPLHMVWNLKLPARQKMLLSGVFLCGIIVNIAALMRIVAIGKLRNEDITHSMVAEYEWSQIEPATAVFCAAIVTYRPLYAACSQKLSQSLSYVNNSDQTLSGHRSWTDMNRSAKMPSTYHELLAPSMIPQNPRRDVENLYPAYKSNARLARS